MAEPAPWRVAEAIAQRHVLRLPEACPHLIVRFQPGDELEVMLEAAELLKKRFPDLRFVLPRNTSFLFGGRYATEVFEGKRFGFRFGEVIGMFRIILIFNILYKLVNFHAHLSEKILAESVVIFPAIPAYQFDKTAAYGILPNC